jgi:hypothetical protein
VRYDLAIGELTGLMRLSEVPWDTPGTWWVDALVTFEVGDGVRRTDGYEIGVTMEPGAFAAAVKARLQFLLGRICAVEATVTHIRPPMDVETILRLQEINAGLVKERREAAKGHKGENGN